MNIVDNPGANNSSYYYGYDYYDYDYDNYFYDDYYGDYENNEEPVGQQQPLQGGNFK